MLQWYKVKYPAGLASYAPQGMVAYRQCSSVDEVKAMFHPEELPHLIITEAPEYQVRLDEIEYWRHLWVNALHNMPYISRDNEGLLLTGSHMALAMCLGYKYRVKGSGQSNAGNKINRCFNEGAKPSTEWRRQALKKLAGPNGTMFARIQLMKLGEDKRFKYWPK